MTHPTPITRKAVEAMADSYKGSGSGVADMLLALLARTDYLTADLAAARETIDGLEQQLSEAHATINRHKQAWENLL